MRKSCYYPKENNNTKFKETEDSRYIYRNKLDRTCFQHDMAYRHFKHLPIRTISDRELDDNAFKVASNLKYDR